MWERIKEAFEDLLVRILLLAATISFIIAVLGKDIHFFSIPLKVLETSNFDI